MSDVSVAPIKTPVYIKLDESAIISLFKIRGQSLYFWENAKEVFYNTMNGAINNMRNSGNEVWCNLPKSARYEKRRR